MRSSLAYIKSKVTKIYSIKLFSKFFLKKIEKCSIDFLYSQLNFLIIIVLSFSVVRALFIVSHRKKRYFYLFNEIQALLLIQSSLIPFNSKMNFCKYFG